MRFYFNQKNLLANLFYHLKLALFINKGMFINFKKNSNIIYNFNFKLIL